MGKLKSYSKFAQQVTLQVQAETLAREQEMPQTNYIYATKSSAFPGLLKIGKTADVSRRVSQLNTGCAPAPHKVVAVAPTFDNDRDERMAHAFFAESRREGEFFEVSEDAVQSFFNAHIAAQYTAEMAEKIAAMQM